VDETIDYRAAGDIDDVVTGYVREAVSRLDEFRQGKAGSGAKE